MFLILLFITELLILFFLSRTLTNLLFGFFYKFTKNKKVSAHLMGFLFLPGTIIHELSHGLMAILLLVHVGKMELWPKLYENGLKLGSIQIGKTDPIRRVMIGGAPFIFGTTIILGTFFYTTQNNLLSYSLSIIAIVYMTFQIGNTMFSSKKDMEGALELALVIAIIIAIFYFAGWRFPDVNPEIIFANEILIKAIKNANLFLAAPIGIDIVVIALLNLLRADYH